MTRVTIDVDQVLAMSEGLGKVTGERLGAALVRAVNATLDHNDPVLRAGMIAGINLPRDYVDRRMEVQRATTTPHAEIIAWGPDRPSRGGLTILGRYDPQVTTRGAPGAKGDPSRGVPAGQRASGVSVRVTGRKTITGAFTMKLRQGNNSGATVGVFIRRAGKARHLYGVSPYSLFRFQAAAHFDDIAADLQQRGGDEIVAEINRVL